RDDVVLYAKSAGRHADFISPLCHLHLGKVKMEVSVKKGEDEKWGENETAKEENREKDCSGRFEFSVLELEMARGSERAGMKGKRDGVVVSACVFPEKELVGRERENSEKRRGGDASITLEKCKRRLARRKKLA
ncbi:hypothetical protein X777_09944, partial [Ooceraea biroi]